MILRVFRSVPLFIFLLSAVALPATASAQNDARIVGSVRDQSGGFIQGATVRVKNDKTGDERTVSTNAEGFFVVNKLAPATYTIDVSYGDFTPIQYPGIPVVTNQEMSLDFELKPKGLTESVTVTGTVPVIDLSSARIGTNVIEREVKDLPINGRQLSQLCLQAPGSVNSGTGTFGDIRFSGRAVEQNMVRYDGVEGTAIIDASPGNLNGEIPSPFQLQSSLENVQEFRVESSNFPAEYGTGTGGQITVVSKSGCFSGISRIGL